MPDDPFKAAFRHLGDMMTAAHVAGMVALGLRLGLFGALADASRPLTSDELARLTGLDERWVREWLYAQAAAEVLTFEADGGIERFRLEPAYADLLADPTSLLYVGNNFSALPERLALVPELEESFRSGVGLSYDDRGPDAAADTESIFANWYRHMLVPVGLPALGDDVVRRLRSGGARVADVGCGSGIALVVMAREFPTTDFHGYEASRHALERAERNRVEAGVDNVRFHHVDDEPLPADRSFDLVTTFDCLHDMTHPADVAAAIRGAIRDDGVWLIADIACAPTFEEFVERRRSFAAMAYSMSVYACMSSSLSAPDGAGLGTCGLPEPKMRALVEAAGFGRFRTLPLEHPVNAFYEARP